MADEATRREVWDGKVPVCFMVDPAELRGASVPEPCFMMISRISYLPMFFEKLEKMYARALNADIEARMWVSFGSVPLKWHLPIGVLFDLFSRDCTLPWELTIHFKNYPKEDILSFEGKESLESHFKSKIKEADWLKHKAEIIQQLTPLQFNKLWQGYLQGNFEEFWSVNQKMMLDLRGDSEVFRYIPFCIYRTGEKVYQRLIPSKDNTLSDLLQQYNRDTNIEIDSINTLIHGITIPLETPLQWIITNLCYPDNFLHISLVPRT